MLFWAEFIKVRARQNLPQYLDPWHANVFVPEGLRAISINTWGNRLHSS